MLIMYLLMQLMCFSSFNNAILTRYDLKSGKTYIFGKYGYILVNLDGRTIFFLGTYLISLRFLINSCCVLIRVSIS